MATIVVNSCTLHFQEMGSGLPIVFTPGGRGAMNIMRPVAEAMAPDYRSFIYDRRNCGASDITISGEESEQEIWADDLAQFIKQLDIGPAYLGGWSAGCRVSLLTAIRHPELVRGLLLGWVTGGAVAAERLAYQYYGQFIEAAQTGGMAAVVTTPYFTERITENSANRERLLSMDVQEFIRVMSRWSMFFTEGADLPVIGATEEELASIQVPTVIIAGDDDIHTLPAAQALHRILPNAQFHSPVIQRDEWDRLWEGPPEALAQARAERAAPIFKEFLQQLTMGQRVAES
ncbi:MAG: alpha/beta hydrolase [Chloroflexi bacterium]|nr:alpha/beta hydrolase [Chloroflexota bacterium]